MSQRASSRKRQATKGSLRTKNVILIVCEGKETETQYFSGFKDTQQPFNIHVVKGKTQDPVDLVKDALRLIEKEGLSVETGDQDSAWCVFDVDDSENAKLGEAKRLADRNNVNIALSNPSIEFWFLLHFLFTTANFPNGDAVIKELIKPGRLPTYQKNRVVYADLSGQKQRDAIRNAQRVILHHHAENRELISRESNPSTHVYKLVELLISNQ